MLKIASILPPLPCLKIVDVGAMSVGEGQEPYSRLLKALPCEVIGFEPIAAECDKLVRMRHEGRSYLPYFIGDGAIHTFYECNFPMTSSLFEPNTPLLAKFQESLFRPKVLIREHRFLGFLDDDRGLQCGLMAGVAGLGQMVVGLGKLRLVLVLDGDVHLE